MEVLYRPVRKERFEKSFRESSHSFPEASIFRTLLDLWSILEMNPFEELRPRGPCFLGAHSHKCEKISCDQKEERQVRTFQAQLPV